MQGEGTLLATGSYDGQARIWNTNGTNVFPIYMSSFTPDFHARSKYTHTYIHTFGPTFSVQRFK